MKTKEKREKSVDEMIAEYSTTLSLTFSTLATLLFYAMYCINREPNFEAFVNIMLISTTVGILFGFASTADGVLARSDEKNKKLTRAKAVKHATIILFLLILLAGLPTAIINSSQTTL